MACADAVDHPLAAYRDALVTVSRRNKELYYTPQRALSLNLTDCEPGPSDSGHAMDSAFVGVTSAGAKLAAWLAAGSLDVTAHWGLKARAHKHVERTLLKLAYKDAAYRQELGIAGTWLLGPFLLWRERPGHAHNEVLITPLYKCAVQLKRGAKKQIVAALGAGGLTINPSLRLHLHKRFGVQLPSVVSGGNACDGITLVQAALQATGRTTSVLDAAHTRVPYAPSSPQAQSAGDVGYRAQDSAVLNAVTGDHFVWVDAFYLDHLSVSRALLMHDVEAIMAEPHDHPGLSALLGTQGARAPSCAPLCAPHTLDKAPEANQMFVMPIDASQAQAVHYAASGQSLVIAGPPGTGKSQTITNLIAQAVGLGKKVLFVSEKRAALDVVYNRLAQANIAQQAVLMHSVALNKPALYQAFVQACDPDVPADDAALWSHAANHVDSAKAQRMAVYEALETVHTPSGLRCADVLAKSAGVHADSLLFLPALPVFARLDAQAIRNVAQALDGVQRAYATVTDAANHPWRRRKTTTLYDVHVVRTLEAGLAQSDAWVCAQAELAAHVTDGHTRLGAERTEALMQALTIDNPPQDITVLMDKRWALYRQAVTTLSAHAAACRPKRAHLRDGANASVLAVLAQPAHSAWAWFTPRFWRLRQQRRYWALGRPQRPAFFARWHSMYAALSCADAAGAALGFVAEGTLWERTAAHAECAARFAPLAQGLTAYVDVFGPTAAARLHTGGLVGALHDVQHLSHLHKRVAQAQKAYAHTWDTVAAWFVPDAWPPSARTPAHLQALRTTASELDGLDRILGCCQRVASFVHAPNHAADLVAALHTLSTPWGAAFEGAIYHHWATALRQNHGVLRTFDREIFEELGHTLADAITAHRKLAAHQVHKAAWAQHHNVPKLHMNLLRKEAHKARDARAPRDVMQDGVLASMLALKPCWLMSPLSVSQILPLTRSLFDLVVFDEASQVRVADAIPAIYRAQAMVVVGDPMQMPPATFFAAHTADDALDALTSDGTQDAVVPSILDLAQQVLPTVRLQWHYRSHSTALIAFANRAFYGGQLLAAPDSSPSHAQQAVGFTHVHGGTYHGKWGNAREAACVVAKLAYLLSMHPERSIGIIAMGQVQADAIADAIAAHCCYHEAFAERYAAACQLTRQGVSAGLFVRALENVQGDERDHILLSVGYAPHALGESLRQNFGPLGQVGGAKRLNVAITRAKIQMHVCVSFAPEAIAVDGQAWAHHPDRVTLGLFLRYAQAVAAGQHAQAQCALTHFDAAPRRPAPASALATAVAEALRALGYPVWMGLGAHALTIDVAVGHPAQPDTWVLGILCDNAVRHGAAYTRDRDVLRPKLLAQRGWRTTAVWSIDWARNWQGEIARLQALLKPLCAPRTPKRIRRPRAQIAGSFGV